jgi:DNA polymerase-3 subunit delta
VKVAKGAIDRTVDRPDPAVRFYLFYGEAEAGSRALAGRLLTALGAEKQGFAGAQLRSDPAALADAAGALSMFGGPRLLWVEPAGRISSPAVEALFSAGAVEHSTVAIAGGLKKTSALLKAADAAKAALTHCSYLPDARSAARLVAELGSREGLRVGPEVAARIAAAAANDQAIIAQELAKFALFLAAGPSAMKELLPEHLDLLGADSPDADAGRAGDLAFAGELARLADELAVAEDAGLEPVRMVRALQRRLLQLAGLRQRLDSGQGRDAVLKSIFWKDQALIGRMLDRWSSAGLAQAFGRLARVERQLIQGGTPPPPGATLGEELLHVARVRRS